MKSASNSANANDKGSGISPVSLGITGGIIPCSSSIAVVLLAVSQGKIAYGIQAILAFGVGLGTALTVTGLVTVAMSRRVTIGSASLSRLLSLAPGVLVAAFGVASLILLLSGGYH